MYGKFLPGLILIALLGTAFFGIVSAAPGSDTAQPNIITSTATGEILTTPDRAEISVGVETENPDVKTAQADNAKIMTDIMTALTGSGILKDDIKTTGYSIYPVYDTTNNLFTKKVKSY